MIDKKSMAKNKMLDKMLCDYKDSFNTSRRKHIYDRFCFALIKLNLVEVNLKSRSLSDRAMYRVYLENRRLGFDKINAHRLVERLRDLRIERLKYQSLRKRATEMVAMFDSFVLEYIENSGYINENEALELTVRWAADEWGEEDRSKIASIVSQVKM